MAKNKPLRLILEEFNPSHVRPEARPYLQEFERIYHAGPELEDRIDLILRLHDSECELDLIRRRWKMCMDANGKRQLQEEGELVKAEIETLKNLQAKAA